MTQNQLKDVCHLSCSHSAILCAVPPQVSMGKHYSSSGQFIWLSRKLGLAESSNCNQVKFNRKWQRSRKKGWKEHQTNAVICFKRWILITDQYQDPEILFYPFFTIWVEATVTWNLKQILSLWKLKLNDTKIIFIILSRATFKIFPACHSKGLITRSGYERMCVGV